MRAGEKRSVVANRAGSEHAQADASNQTSAHGFEWRLVLSSRANDSGSWVLASSIHFAWAVGIEPALETEVRFWLL